MLRQDPFNLNFVITTWTNETPILKAASKFSKWIGDWDRTGIFSRESYYTIVNFCDIDTLFKWRRVCKLTNMFVIQLDEVWRTHFYSRHWKLRHDLENYFFGVDPLLEDKSLSSLFSDSFQQLHVMQVGLQILVQNLLISTYNSFKTYSTHLIGYNDLMNKNDYKITYLCFYFGYQTV